MHKIAITILDDHKLFRDGLAALLSKHEEFEIVACLESGEKLFEYLKENTPPEIILLDISMPKIDGFEVLKTLQNIQTKAIAISMHDDGNYIAKCAKLGAYGYLLKNTDEDELLLAIKTVHQGKKYFNAAISQKLVESLSEKNTVEKLTKKETQIVKLLAEGLTTKEIAVKLYISTRTVDTHRANMLRKLNVKNTAELIKKTIQKK